MYPFNGALASHVDTLLDYLQLLFSLNRIYRIILACEQVLLWVPGPPLDFDSTCRRALWARIILGKYHLPLLPGPSHVLYEFR